MSRKRQRNQRKRRKTYRGHSMTDEALLRSARSEVTKAQKRGVVVVAAWECNDPACLDHRAPPHHG